MTSIDWKLFLGVALPLIAWLLLLVIVLWKILKKYTLNKEWSRTNPNPYKGETLAMPRGAIRGMLTLTILLAAILFQIYAIHNTDLEKIQPIMGAFELVMAFYFGSKVMHHLASADRSKTQAVANASAKPVSDFNDPEAAG